MGNFIPNDGGTKRKSPDSDGSGNEKPAKRIKMNSTGEYIYNTLFRRGEGSDVTLVAFGKEWKLHKLYLSQCNFFKSMFSGAWRESSAPSISLTIADELIDEEAFQITIGSLYNDDMYIKADKVVNILATAAWLGLEQLMKACGVVMLENINLATACEYFTASVLYGQLDVKEACVVYLENNIMLNFTVELLKDTSVELMSRLVESTNLCVFQVEMDVYTMLRRWLFLKIHPDWSGEMNNLTQDCKTYFHGRPQDAPSFLESIEGAEYAKTFVHLRLDHIVLDQQSCTIIETDRIIPNSWLLKIFRHQWLRMIRINEGRDVGPVEINEQQTQEKVLKYSFRCGRKLQNPRATYCWRWMGFNFGLDLIITWADGVLKFRRNSSSINTHGTVDMQTVRSFLYRANLITLNEYGHQTVDRQTTTLKSLSLKKDEEREVFALKRIPASPMYICCHFLVFSVLSDDDNIIPFRLSSCLPLPHYSSISHGPRPEDLRNNDVVTNGQNNNFGPGEALENL